MKEKLSSYFNIRILKGNSEWNFCFLLCVYVCSGGGAASEYRLHAGQSCQVPLQLSWSEVDRGWLLKLGRGHWTQVLFKSSVHLTTEPFFQRLSGGITGGQASLPSCYTEAHSICLCPFWSFAFCFLAWSNQQLRNYSGYMWAQHSMGGRTEML